MIVAIFVQTVNAAAAPLPYRCLASPIVCQGGDRRFALPAAFVRLALSTAMTDALIPLCATADVPEGGALRVETADLTLAVFKVGGRFYVIDDQCTHGPGSLSEGCVDGEEIECDFHGGRFHLPTGAVAGPPCMLPVQTYRTRIVDDLVCIDPAPCPLADK